MAWIQLQADMSSAFTAVSHKDLAMFGAWHGLELWRFRLSGSVIIFYIMVKIGIKEGANCGVAVKDDLSGNPPHAIRLPNNVYLTSDLTHPLPTHGSPRV